MRIPAFAIALVVAGTCLAHAQAAQQDVSKQDAPKTPRVTRRQVNQQARIHQGVKSGELTPAETRRLEAEQAKIKADKAAAKSDGKVTPQERNKLRREQNKASRDIHRLKHNARTTTPKP
jgi:protein-disulfide isomerase